MRGWIAFALGIIIGMVTGLLWSENRACSHVEHETIVDTVVYPTPQAVASMQTGVTTVTLPVYRFHSYEDCLHQIRVDTAHVAMCGDSTEVERGDSVSVTLPVEQTVYEAKEYKAYVSGVYARLDSVMVYPEREVTVIKKPPKRWHIGPTVGYGITPRGMAPYAGISVTYSIFSF